MDAMEYARFIFGLLVVLALIGLFALALRRFGPMAGVPVRKGSERRLAVLEVLALDARRRLVLVRRDDVEHLLLLGVTDDLVVEGGIRTAGRPERPAGFQEALARAGSEQPSP